MNELRGDSVKAIVTQYSTVMIFIGKRLALHLSRSEAASIVLALDDDVDAPAIEGITVNRWGETNDWLIDTGWMAYRMSKGTARKLRKVLERLLLGSKRSETKDPFNEFKKAEEANQPS